MCSGYSSLTNLMRVCTFVATYNYHRKKNWYQSTMLHDLATNCACFMIMWCCLPQNNFQFNQEVLFCNRALNTLHHRQKCRIMTEFLRFLSSVLAHGLGVRAFFAVIGHQVDFYSIYSFCKFQPMIVLWYFNTIFFSYSNLICQFNTDWKISDLEEFSNYRVTVTAMYDALGVTRMASSNEGFTTLSAGRST